MRLLVLSNSTQHGSGYLDYCEEELRSFLSNARTILFVPFALHDWNAYTEHARLRFRQMGFELTGIHENDDTKKSIAQTDVIFTGGGNTFRLLNELYTQGLLKTIRRAVLGGTRYMGASAGSNIACPTIKTTNDMPIVYPPSFDALNLVPFNINPHYVDPDPHSKHQGETREQRIREYHEMNDNPVIGLREGSMLRIENENATLKGLNGAKLFQKAKDPTEFASGDDVSFLLK